MGGQALYWNHSVDILIARWCAYGKGDNSTEMLICVFMARTILGEFAQCFSCFGYGLGYSESYMENVLIVYFKEQVLILFWKDVDSFA